MPVIVGSRISGKALLVPVDMPAIGHLAAFADDRPVRAVAAEHDDRRDAGGAHHGAPRGTCRRRWR